MKASSKQERLGTSGPAEAHPHQIRASSYYQRSIAKRSRIPAVAKATKLILHGYGRRNPTVFAVREAYGIVLAHAKQPGRRFGPSPVSVNINPGDALPKGRRTAALAAKHARQESDR